MGEVFNYKVPEWAKKCIRKLDFEDISICDFSCPLYDACEWAGVVWCKAIGKPICVFSKKCTNCPMREVRRSK